MRVPRHFLAATDLSPPSLLATERAARLAADTRAELGLLQVASLAPLEKLRHLLDDMPVDTEQRLLARALEETATLASQLHERYGIAVEPHVAPGALLPEILTQAAQDQTELVVVGARGGNFMRHALLGSTAERLIRKTRLPVLVVKQAVTNAYKTVLVPVDFSDSSLAALDWALTLPGVEIILLHVLSLPFEGKLWLAGVDDDRIAHYRNAARHEATEKLATLCEARQQTAANVRLLVVNGDPAQCILDKEKEYDCDLIALGKQGESLVEELLIGSVTRYVLGESSSDVLVVTTAEAHHG